ncbi:MAG: maleylacetoacetate isomerase [Myxococcota bacterium]
MPRYRLHNYWRSSTSFRVRVALEHKGLGYEYVPVHLVRDGGQQYREAYLELNPMAEVPALEVVSDEGETVAVLTQSVAILEYLEEIQPEPALLPEDPVGRAEVRRIVEVVNSGIHPIQNLKVMRRLHDEFGADRPRGFAWSAYWIDRGFRGLERILERTAGDHAVGDAVTLADVCIAPQVLNAGRFGVDMEPFPAIRRVHDAAMALDAFRAAAPERQPDAQ